MQLVHIGEYTVRITALYHLQCNVEWYETGGQYLIGGILRNTNRDVPRRSDSRNEASPTTDHYTSSYQFTVESYNRDTHLNCLASPPLSTVLCPRECSCRTDSKDLHHCPQHSIFAQRGLCKVRREQKHYVQPRQPREGILAAAQIQLTSVPNAGKHRATYDLR